MKLDSRQVDLNKLMSFLEVAESGAVTAASQRLGLTRSAVSHSLRTLEDQLGVPLFHRIGKRLVLTSEGKLLQRAVGDVRGRLGIALDELRGLGSEVRGSVRVGLFLGFSRFLIADIIDAFAREHVATDVRISFGPQSWLTEQLLAGKLDMALALRPGGEQAARIRSVELSAAPLVLALRTQKQKSAPRTFAQIRALTFVDYYRSAPLIDRWTRHHFADQRVPPEHVRAWAASTDLALELVLRGTGAAVLPADVAEPYRRSKQLMVIAGPGAPLVDHVWLNDLAGARSARAVTTFHALLQQRLGH